MKELLKRFRTHAQAPLFFAEPKEYIASQTVMNHNCGDKLTLYITENGNNTMMYFTAEGCSLTVGAASLFLSTINKNFSFKCDKGFFFDIIGVEEGKLGVREKCVLLVFDAYCKLRSTLSRDI